MDDLILDIKGFFVVTACLKEPLNECRKEDVEAHQIAQADFFLDIFLNLVSYVWYRKTPSECHIFV